MPTGGCEVQAEQPSDPPAYPDRFKPLLERVRADRQRGDDPAGLGEYPYARLGRRRSHTSPGP
jgi:hypothetical protein